MILLNEDSVYLLYSFVRDEDQTYSPFDIFTYKEAKDSLYYSELNALVELKVFSSEEIIAYNIEAQRLYSQKIKEQDLDKLKKLIAIYPKEASELIKNFNQQ